MPRLRSGRLLGGILCILPLLLTLAAPARAGMVPTDRVLHGAEAQRAALVEALQRDEIRSELRALGVAPGEAAARVGRLTDAEVARLHRQVDALPAGGDISTVELLLIIIIILLLV